MIARDRSPAHLARSRKIERAIRGKRAIQLVAEIVQAHPDDARRLLSIALRYLSEVQPVGPIEARREDATWWSGQAMPMEFADVLVRSVDE
jgi:hypothetical protein